ncbi:fusion protein [Pacific salmon paramyxovirus]|uniref:Fusion glycoprotein F0 n=1 Tax=Pacific salmon paramyxovirus TaxID=348289 RepID=A0A3G2KTE2_9MONO|nr:fusion protein [Salmon aquaparamyxovirus]AYN62577.1 fusion protein [Pacific salmon paramyxovirus]
MTIKLVVRVAVILVSLSITLGQVDYGRLRKIGVFEKQTMNLKLSISASQRYMVIKTVPNLGTVSSCGDKEMAAYKESIRKLISPMHDMIEYIKGEVVVEAATSVALNGTQVRFFGLVVAIGALGLATSAQITAGIALHNSLENAKAIKGLSDAMKESNQAIQKLQDATAGTVIALNALQDQINTQIVPALNSLGCSVVSNTLGVALTRYYSELVQLFGPSLANPVEAPLSIQAISGAFNGDLKGMIRDYGYSPSDLEDIIRTGAITGRVIDVDMDDLTIILEISLPTLLVMRDTKVVNFGRITYNLNGSEWQTLSPDWIAIRNTLMSGVDLSTCVISRQNLICKQDPTFAIDHTVSQCLRGEITSCPRGRVVNSIAPRFAIVNGNVLGNCVATTCLCGDPGTPVIQDASSSLTIMSIDKCELVSIDGYNFRPGPPVVNTTFHLSIDDIGPEVSVNPIDISGALGKIEQDLQSSKEHLANSDTILASINPNIINTNAAIGLIAVSSLGLITAVVALCWLCCLTKSMVSRDSTAYIGGKGPDMGPIMSSLEGMSF